MPTPNGYDPKKAAAYNKLIQSGMSEDAAFAQSGITDAEAGNYALGTNGQLGATVAGAGKVAGVDYALPTAAETAESNRFNQGLASSSKFEEAGYPEKASAPPGAVKPITYTTTSTESVSGGGSTTITAGPRQPTASSQAIQPAITAKQAEIDQFIKDNPSDFARKKQGLPPLSPEEKQQRQEQLDKLTAERGELKNQQTAAETPGTPTVTTTPNTTTTDQTVTASTASTNQQVDPQSDQKLAQENESQLDATASVANSTTVRDATPVSETTVNEDGQIVAVETAEPADDPYETERLRAEQALSDPEPTFSPEDVGEEDPFEARRLELEQEQNREELAQTVTEPEPVPDTQTRTVVASGTPDLVTSPEPVPSSLAGPTGTPYDDDGNLNPGWSLDENNNPVFVGGNFVEPATQNSAEKSLKESAINQATFQARYKQPQNADWRVRISLSAGSKYLYNLPAADQGILAPLAKTDGVVFPYTPSIETNYVANYDKYDLVHSNYRGAFYKNSAVNDISVRGVFTAQDTNEASYMLAVIHFFRSVTKMFYGKDEQRGAPPPLVYLTGFGDYQFAGHPCVVTNFSYSLPSDVDYIRANNPNNYGTDLLNRRSAALSSPTAFSGQNARQAILSAVGIPFGATPAKPVAGPITNSVTNTARATYVPTKIEINVTLLPMQTRDQISKQFSLKEFANGKLIQGGFW